MAQFLQSIKEIAGVCDTEDEIVPFVPKADSLPKTVDNFLNISDRQFRSSYQLLLNTADVLEAKAAELRRRADKIMTNLAYMDETVTESVRFEEECRHVAQSLSLISPKEGE